MCCGVEGYADWFYSAQWPGHRFVPDSCCDSTQFSDDRGAMTNCGKVEGNEQVFHKSGCSVMFTDWLLQHLAIVGVLALMFVMVEASDNASARHILMRGNSDFRSLLLPQTHMAFSIAREIREGTKLSIRERRTNSTD